MPPIRRKLRLAGRRPRRVVRRKVMRGFNPNPMFTETFVAGTVAGNSGGIFNVSINQMPQVTQYSALYNQYKITSLKVMLVPDLNSFDGTQTLNGAGMPRIAYAINDTPDDPPPVTENDILSDNGCRIRTLTSKLAIRCSPKPQRPNASLGVEVIDTRSSPYFTFAQAGQTNPVYSGIAYWISQILSGGAVVNRFHVYYKVTFMLRDPK